MNARDSRSDVHRCRRVLPVPVVAVLAGIAGGLLLCTAVPFSCFVTPYVIELVVRWGLAHA